MRVKLHSRRFSSYAGTSTADNEEYRKAIRLKEQDIFIAGGALQEGRMMERDPVGWVNKYLDAQR